MRYQLHRGKSVASIRTLPYMKNNFYHVKKYRALKRGQSVRKNGNTCDEYYAGININNNEALATRLIILLIMKKRWKRITF